MLIDVVPNAFCRGKEGKCAEEMCEKCDPVDQPTNLYLFSSCRFKLPPSSLQKCQSSANGFSFLSAFFLDIRQDFPCWEKYRSPGAMDIYIQNKMAYGKNTNHPQLFVL